MCRLVRFLGTLLFHGLAATIFERPTWRRKEVAIFVDEFQDYLGSVYATAGFQALFAQGRRYKVSLAIAHQDFGSVPQQLLHSIHANAGVLCSFGVGPGESEMMSKIFGAQYPAQTIAFLDDHNVIARLGTKVVEFQTEAPPLPLRSIIPDESLSFREDPRDPLEEFVSRQSQRDPYRDTRKPRHPRRVASWDEELLG